MVEQMVNHVAAKVPEVLDMFIGQELSNIIWGLARLKLANTRAKSCCTSLENLGYVLIGENARRASSLSPQGLANSIHQIRQATSKVLIR